MYIRGLGLPEATENRPRLDNKLSVRAAHAALLKLEHEAESKDSVGASLIT